MGDSGFLALPQEPRNAQLSSLLSKQKQTTMGKKLPGKHLKISFCSKHCIMRDWEELLSDYGQQKSGCVARCGWRDAGVGGLTKRRVMQRAGLAKRL